MQAFASKQSGVCLTNVHVDFFVNSRNCIGGYHHCCSCVVLSANEVKGGPLPSKVQGRHLKLPALGADARDGAQYSGSLLHLQEAAAGMWRVWC